MELTSILTSKAFIYQKNDGLGDDNFGIYIFRKSQTLIVVIVLWPGDCVTAIIYKSCIFPQKILSLQSKVTRAVRGNGIRQMWLLLTSCNQEMLSSAFCGTDKHQFSGLFAANLGSICSSHTGGAQYKWADIIGPQDRLFPKIEIHGVPRTKEEWQHNEERLQTLRLSTKY